MQLIGFYKSEKGEIVKIHDDGAGDFVVSANGFKDNWKTIHQADYNQSARDAIASYLDYNLKESFVRERLQLV